MEDQNINKDVFNVQIDEQGRMSIKTMASWAMIIVITSLAGFVLSVISYTKNKQEAMDVYESMGNEGFGRIFKFASQGNITQLILSILIGLLLIYFLHQFASRAKKGVETLDPAELNSGLAGLKNYFMALGIISIIVIALILIALIFLTLFV